jgi:hypothetical protein
VTNLCFAGKSGGKRNGHADGKFDLCAGGNLDRRARVGVSNGCAMMECGRR